MENNQIDERFDKEFSHKNFSFLYRDSLGIQDISFAIKAFLHAELEAARKDERRKTAMEVIGDIPSGKYISLSDKRNWVGRDAVQIGGYLEDLIKELTQKYLEEE